MGKFKITLISDTHGKHNQVTKDLPGGDILIHAGDFMTSGWNEMEALMFLKWYDEIKNYDTKIFIAGNHDRWFENEPEEIKDILTGYKTIDYLQDEEIELWDSEDQELIIYGSPWQPEFYNWAFNLPRHSWELEQKWNDIPPNTDILVTHSPPYGHLDIPGGQSVRVGCEMLRYRVDMIKPKIHIFGHIHGGYGYYFDRHTHFFNASMLNERYAYTNLPFNFEWDSITNEITWL